MGFQETRQVFSGQCRENVKEKKAAKETVTHRSADQHHRHRTQSVLTRRPPHPARLTGAPKQKWVAKCELNTWEWQNSKVASATLNIPYESTCSCKAPSILHAILWCLSFIRWSAGLKCPRSRTFTPHRGRLFPYMKHLTKLSCQRRWNSFWRPGHRWWRASINISI